MSTVRSLELIVQTNEETKLSSLTTELDSITRTMCKVPKNSWLYIKLPCSILTKVISECKTSLCCQLCIVTAISSTNKILVTESHPVTYTCFCTNFETTIWIVVTEQVCEVDCTVQTEVHTTNDCVAISKT